MLLHSSQAIAPRNEGAIADQRAMARAKAALAKAIARAASAMANAMAIAAARRLRARPNRVLYEVK